MKLALVLCLVIVLPLITVVDVHNESSPNYKKNAIVLNRLKFSNLVVRINELFGN